MMFAQATATTAFVAIRQTSRARDTARSRTWCPTALDMANGLVNSANSAVVSALCWSCSRGCNLLTGADVGLPATALRITAARFLPPCGRFWERSRLHHPLEVLT